MTSIPGPLAIQRIPLEPLHLGPPGAGRGGAAACAAAINELPIEGEAGGGREGAGRIRGRSFVRRPDIIDSMAKPFRFGIGKWVGLAIVVLCIYGFALLPHVTPSMVVARENSCENNLRQLGFLMKLYSEQFGGKERRFPTETGNEFWLKLARTNPPLLEGGELEVMICPDVDPLPPAGSTTYYGPRRDVNSANDQDYIACCWTRSHPHGPLALRKDGKVERLSSKETDRLLRDTKE